MLAAVKRNLKNEKGLTLIELLAVVVILGIIAAIAIPSIGGLIDNTKKDAHVANAQQMVSSAKTWAAGNPGNIPAGGTKLTLTQMETQGLIDPFEDPDKTASGYDKINSYVNITQTGKVYKYEVKLVNAQRGIWASDPKFITRANVPDNAVPTAAATAVAPAQQ